MTRMFHWVEVRTFCHATEEEDRVLAAVRTVMPEGEVHRDTLEGHFGNPLIVLTARTDAAADVRAVWSRIVAAIGAGEALRELDARLDDDLVFHLRLDKQRAYRGEIAKASSPDVIAVRAKVAAFPKKREVATRALRALLEGL